MTLFSHHLIENRTYIKTNIEDFDASLQKEVNIQSQFFLYKLKLLAAKTYPNFVRVDEFLCDL